MAKTRSENIAKKIAEAISESKAPDQPWCEGLIPKGDPAITIEGYGEVKLPMRPKDVRELNGFALQAPYGKGTETIVDTSVRDTLEVDAALVTLAPEFNEAIEHARQEIAANLSLDRECLKAELYKLLIYPKGGFFLPHRDSEKRKGMVATMVVVLPSKFGGGDLLIHHSGRRHVFSFSHARSQEQPQYVAFFADCQHEVKKVTSGVRVCLTFNLILQPKRTSRKSNLDSKADPALLKQVGSWVQDRPSDPLVFCLDHQYTEASLGPKHLKGYDKEMHRSIAAVADTLGCQLFFGQVERHLCQHADDGSFGYGRHRRRGWSGDYDDLMIGEVFDDEIVIDGWRSARGEPVDLASLSCGSSQLISLVSTEDWIPTRQDYEGYTGNAGNTLDRWYHKSVIAIWSSDQRYEILTQMGLEYAVAELLQMRADLARLADEEIEQACCNCQKLAEAIIDHWPDNQHNYHHQYQDTQPWIRQYLNELPKFDDPDLIERILATIAKRDWQTNLDQFVIISLKRMGVDDILPMLKRLLEFEPPPNQYGVRFLEGLATRDAKWLLKLAKDKKTGGLSKQQLNELLSIAVEKLSAHSRRIPEEQYSRSQPPTESLLVLQQAAIAAKNDRLVKKVLRLVYELPSVFNFRSFQVPSAVKLRDFAINQNGETPDSVTNWITELKQKLSNLTAESPKPPSDFRRKPATEDGWHSGRYIEQLNEFLSDPTLEQTRIAAAEGTRRQIEHIIHSQRLDVMTKTIKIGRPYSIELTKTIASHLAEVKQYESDQELLKTLG